MTLSGQSPLLVDPRTGSGELLPALRRRGCPAKSEQLPAGDFAFVGRGKDGVLVRVGIERKRLSDVLQCIQDGRFAGHQLPLLHELYDVRWLIVEGSWRGDPKTGLLQIPAGRGKWTDYAHGGVKLESALDNWLLDMQYKGGVAYWRTWNDEETANHVARQYNWWCAGKGWDGHDAHLALHRQVDASIWERRLSQVGKTAASFPGVDKKLARKVQEQFKTAKQFVNAKPSELRKVFGVAQTVKIMAAFEAEG